MRSAHCYSNENNDPMLVFQGFAIPSVFVFFFLRGSGFEQTAPVLIAALREWLSPAFRGGNLWFCTQCILCYYGSQMPDALKYVISGFTSPVALLGSLLVCVPMV